MTVEQMTASLTTQQINMLIACLEANRDNNRNQFISILENANPEDFHAVVEAIKNCLKLIREIV